MPVRLIEVTAEQGHADSIRAVADRSPVIDYRCGPVEADGRQTHRLLLDRGDRQALLDALQRLLSGSEAARIVVFAPEAVIPAPQASEQEQAEERRGAISATREELYTAVAHGADLHRTFVLLTVLSTVVAAIGLAANNVAVVIGAMVIAPLLGPNLAFALATALGDKPLMLRALGTGMACRPADHPAG